MELRLLSAGLRKGFFMKNKGVRFYAAAGMIGAIYVILTMISAFFGLDSGAIQLRISEMLCVLPIYTTAAIPGVTIGCLLSNLLLGGTIWDIAFGTLATLIGVTAAYFLRRFKYLAFIPTVISNMIIIPAVLIASGIGEPSLFWYFSLTVGLGELISCGGFGTAMIIYLDRHRSIANRIFIK